jgi:phenylacetate-CoA ligase
MKPKTYFDNLDFEQLLTDYPVGDPFLETYRGMTPEQLRELQNRRFLILVKRAWEIPFYQRVWGNAGIVPADINSLDDIEKLPLISKSDIMDSVERCPPFGDFSGLEGMAPAERPSVVFHTTSGTTGTPQPLLFGAKGREVQSLLVARGYHLMGLPPASVIQSCYGHGTINGGHYIREAVTHYTNSVFLSAGTGLETPSVRQVQLMKTYGVNVLVGFADYIKKLADVARAEGLEPGVDIKIDMIIGHLGQGEAREALREAWGGKVRLFDWYGVGDTGSIAGEGPEQDGMYVWEDAQYLEVLDTETNQPVAEGAAGNMVVTCLHKDDIYPLIRFNTCDITEVIPGQNSLGIPFRRIRGFLGRSDNMVKLRGINIYPTGIGAILEQRDETLGEYICRVSKDSAGREEMTVIAEVSGAADAYPQLQQAYSELLRRELGIEIGVELVGEGGTAALTEIESRQKPRRLLDDRD